MLEDFAVFNTDGEEVERITLPEEIFGIKPNVPVMHTVVVNYLANQRQGNQSALTRAEVSGGGKKPWRQKGTGHARQGSTRAPQWRHGGIVFAPKPREYRYNVNKKVRRLALKSSLSSKVIENQILILDKIELDDIKTKFMVKILQNLKISGKILFVLPGTDKKVILSSRNISGVKTIQFDSLNTYAILNCTKLVILKDSIAKIREVYA